jgi:DnaJ-class molecular chaperone
MTTKQKCDWCEGSGNISKICEDSPTGFTAYDCPQCGGKGYIIKQPNNAKLNVP